jgi:hypothetical protein
MDEKEKLKFRMVETSDVIYLYFSDGNVLSADDKGIIAYSTVKTLEFNAKETKVHTTFIEGLDGEVKVWILPSTKRTGLGLHNDIRLSDCELTIRQYEIPEKYYNKFKDFIWQKTIDKAWPDD